ncbi:MAG: WD40/YVTN/BNR-like repeat-containing protein [Solirubrobacterales bacterium]
MKIGKARPLFKSIVVASLAALTLLMAASSASAVTAGNTGWEWSNPLPQGNSLTTVETVGNRVFAGGANGTLIRSDDAGASWTAARTGLLDRIQSIRAISSESIVFAARCALRRSDDGGNTVRRLAWGPSDDTCGSEIAAFHFPAPSIGYLLLKNGEILTTSDSGETWTKKTAAPGSKAVGGAADVADVWFTGPAEGVVSVGGQVFRTTDGANSWTPVLDLGGAGLYVFDFTSATHGVAVGNSAATLITTNGGATWSSHASLASGENLRALSCASVTHCLAATADSQRILNSVDGGVTWTPVTASTAKLAGVGLVNPSRGIAVGATGTIVSTDDTGATWTQINGGVAGEFSRISALSPNNAVITGRNGALAHSTDGGRSWRPVNVSTSAEVVDAAFVGVSRGYVLDGVGAVLRTDNAGSSWRFLDTGTTSRARNLHVVNDSTLLLVGPKGILRSTNAGETFSALGNRAFRRLAMSKLDVAGSTLFAYGSKVLVVSKNKGRRWSRVKIPKRIRTIRVLDMVSAKVGYLLDTKNELWSTSTAGRKWKRIETTGAGSVSSMAFGNRLNGYLTSTDGRVLMTRNAGKTWSRQYPFYDQNSSRATLLEAPSSKSAFLLVAGSNRVFSTTTGGAIGRSSRLTIKSSSKRVRKKTVIKVTGKLSPALGGERVTVLARTVGAKSGTRWTSQERTVSASGTFTTSWRVRKPTIFIARWSGDAARDGSGAKSVKVLIRR